MTITAETPAPATTVRDVPTLSFVEPMLGFPQHRVFALAQVDDEGVLCALRSLEEDGLRFLVVPPSTFFPDYAPEIDDDLVARLGVDTPEDLVCLVVVTTGGRPQDATANLLAPVVVNHRTRLAAQVVQSADLPVRAPLWGVAPGS